MEKALLICGKSAGAAAYLPLLRGVGISKVDACGSANEARQRLQYLSYELILVSAPLPDEFGVELMIDLEESSDASLCILVPNELFEEIQVKVEPLGVLCMAKPVNKRIFAEAIRVLVSVHHTVLHLKEENRKLSQKLNDSKIINRAKYCLMQYLEMDEAAAHRYIQKQAMDMRIAQRIVAENILKAYET